MNINIYPKFKEFEHLLELYPPQLANKYLPEWYKNQKFYKYFDVVNETNITKGAKNCPAIQDEMTSGVVIPSWSDIYIYKNKDGTISWEVKAGNAFLTNDEWISSQHINQIEGMGLNAIDNFGILKLISPYYYETSKGYGLRFSDPFYHHRKNIRLLPGMVETDIWHETNFPFEFFVDIDNLNNKKLMIKAGEPLCMITPYKKETTFKLSINKFDEEFDSKQIKNLKLLYSVSNNYPRYKNYKSKNT
jgi:hypothetical protein